MAEEEPGTKRRRLEEQAFQFLALSPDLRLQVMAKMPFRDIIAVCSASKALMAWCDDNQPLWNMVLFRNVGPEVPTYLDWNTPLPELTVRAIRDLVEPLIPVGMVAQSSINARNLALAWILTRRSEVSNPESPDRRAAPFMTRVDGPFTLLQLERVDSKEDVTRANFGSGYSRYQATVLEANRAPPELVEFLGPALDAFFGTDFEEEFLRGPGLRYFLPGATRAKITAFFLYLLASGWIPYTPGLDVAVANPETLLNLKEAMGQLPVGEFIPDFKRLMLMWADVFDYPDWARSDPAMARMIRSPGFWRRQMQARQPRGFDPAAWPTSFDNDRRRYIAETAAAYLYRGDAEMTYLHFPLVAGRRDIGVTLGRARGIPSASVAYWSSEPDLNPATSAVRKFIYEWEKWQRTGGGLVTLDEFVERARNASPLANDGLTYGSWVTLEPDIPGVQTVPNQATAAIVIYLILDSGMRWEEPQEGKDNARTRFIRTQMGGGYEI